MPGVCFHFHLHFRSFSVAVASLSHPPLSLFVRRNHLAYVFIQYRSAFERFQPKQNASLASVFEPRISGLVGSSQSVEFMALDPHSQSQFISHGRLQNGQSHPSAPHSPNQLTPADGGECALFTWIVFSHINSPVSLCDRHGLTSTFGGATTPLKPLLTRPSPYRIR